MSKYLINRYCDFDEYTPGEQPQDKKYIKLNTNESPYPPSPKVFEAVNSKEVADLRLYPDPDSSELCTKLAQTYGVNKENIFVSNGSDDILNFSFMAFCGEQTGAIFPDITYGFYEVFANLHAVKFTKIPLNEDFTVNPDDYCNTGKTVFIANPNAPTGLALSKECMEKIVKTNPDNAVIIDEAYVDFSGDSCAELTKKYDNLLVVMTYSKSRSLAGARLGFAIGNESLIADLNKIKYSTNPYNINRLTMTAGIAALEDNDYFKNNCEEICKTRSYTAQELKKLGFNVLASKANFLFAKHKSLSGEYIYKSLKENGILIRHFDSERIKDYNRISIGTMEQMDSLISALTKIITERKNYENSNYNA